MKPNNISSIAPILPVRDLSRSLSFYEQLGFTTEFLWQEPPTYAVLTANEANLHLSLLAPQHRDRKVRSVLYLFVQDVDQMYESCQAAGLAIEVELGDRDYGMRDFELLDPDGHLLTFGESR